jgi:putative flippase GtrA
LKCFNISKLPFTLSLTLSTGVSTTLGTLTSFLLNDRFKEDIELLKLLLFFLLTSEVFFSFFQFFIEILNLCLFLLDNPMFILQLSLFSLLHIVLLRDCSDLFLDLVDHLLLLLLELILLDL